MLTGEVAGKRSTCSPPAGAPVTEETVRLGDIENRRSTLRIPIARVRESTGSFVLVAGREARLGEEAVDVSSPRTVQRAVFEPLLGPPPATLPDC